MGYDTDGALGKIKEIKGFIAAAVGHAESGMAMGTIGGGDSFNIDIAVATNSEVVKAKLKAAQALGIDGGIEDILITLQDQYHLIRPLRSNPVVFFYLALNRADANLAMARFALEQVESKYEL